MKQVTCKTSCSRAVPQVIGLLQRIYFWQAGGLYEQGKGLIRVSPTATSIAGLINGWVSN